MQVSLQSGCVRTIQYKYYQYEIPWQPVQWQWQTDRQTGTTNGSGILPCRQTDRHHQAIFCNCFAKGPGYSFTGFSRQTSAKMSAILRPQLLALVRSIVQATCHVSQSEWRLSSRATQQSHGPMDRCAPDGSERHMSLPATYTYCTREKTSRCSSSLSALSSCLHLLLLCLFFPLPITVLFQFSPLFLYFMLLYVLPTTFLLLSVFPSAPLLYFLHHLLFPSSHVSFFYIFAPFSMPHSFQFLPLFSLHATYCSVSFLSLFV